MQQVPLVGNLLDRNQEAPERHPGLGWRRNSANRHLLGYYRIPSLEPGNLPKESFRNGENPTNTAKGRSDRMINVREKTGPDGRLWFRHIRHREPVGGSRERNRKDIWSGKFTLHPATLQYLIDTEENPLIKFNLLANYLLNTEQYSPATEVWYGAHGGLVVVQIAGKEFRAGGKRFTAEKFLPSEPPAFALLGKRDCFPTTFLLPNNLYTVPSCRSF